MNGLLCYPASYIEGITFKIFNKFFIYSWAKCLFDRPRTYDTSDDLDAWKFSGYPGLSYTAKDQCEILLRDHMAYEFVKGDLSQVCDNLHCRTPNKSGFFFAGPALQGTDCGNGKWCEGGSCQYKKKLTTTTKASTSIQITTTMSSNINQNQGACQSECLQQGKGIKKFTDNDSGKTKIQVCDDEKVCKTRKSVATFGTERCKEFSKNIKEIDGKFQKLLPKDHNFCRDFTILICTIS
jgi:a disintegrin and metalloproteinase with thrombospondin motifs 18